MKLKKLKKGDVLMKGDEVFNPCVGQWVEIQDTNIGDIVSRHIKYRRAVYTPSELTDASFRFKLPRIKGSREPKFAFLIYHETLWMIDDKWRLGLKRPFTTSDYSGILPVKWIASFGHYTEEEIYGFVDNSTFFLVNLAGEDCVYRHIPIGRIGIKLEKLKKKQKIKVDTLKEPVKIKAK